MDKEQILFQIKEHRRLLEIFPSRGRNDVANRALAARREKIRARLVDLEAELARLQDLEAEQRLARIRAEAETERATRETLAKAPRCVMLSNHLDAEGEIIPSEYVLARYIGEIDPDSPLVVFRDFDGTGAWQPRYQYPECNLSGIPDSIVVEIKRQWEAEVREWREFVNSLQRVERKRSFSYLGDDDSLKYGEEIIFRWVAPDGRELPYPPPEPRGLEARLEAWWWENVFPTMRPQMEAEWREKAIAFLASLGWQVID